MCIFKRHQIFRLKKTVCRQRVLHLKKKPLRSHVVLLFGKYVKRRKKLILEQHLGISSLVNSSLFVVYMLSLKILFYFFVIENGNDRPSIARFLAASVLFFDHNFPKCDQNDLKF